MATGGGDLKDSFFDDPDIDEITDDKEVLTDAEQIIRMGIGRKE